MATIVLLSLLSLGTTNYTHSGYVLGLFDNEDSNERKDPPMADEAKKVPKKLVEALQSEDVLERRMAAMTLEGLGKKGLPFVQMALKDSYGPVRAYAALALYRIEPAQLEKTLDVLNGTLADDLVGSRLDSARILGEIGAPAKSAVPVLCKALKDSNERVRSAVAQTLGTILSRPDLSIPALVDALKDDDWFVRSQVAQSLGNFGPQAKPAIRSLETALNDEQEVVRLSAATALRRIDGKVDVAVVRIVRELENVTKNSRHARAYAAELIGGIGKEAHGAVTNLKRACKDPERTVRISAAYALWKVSGHAEISVPVLVAEIKDEQYLSGLETDTVFAIKALGEIGPKAKHAVPGLINAHGKSGRHLRENIVDALRKIDPAAAKRLQQ